MKKALLILPLFLIRTEGHAQTIPNYTVIWGDRQASVGYYFLHAFKPTGSATGFNSMLLDRYGNLVYTKRFNFSASDFKLQPNGQISYTTSYGILNNTKFFIMDSTFNLRDSVQCANGIYTDSHDLRILSNGHYLLLGYEFTIMDLSSYHWFSGNGSPGSTTASVRCGVIEELNENKTPVFIWKASDHFTFGEVQQEWLFNPNNVDWTHFNSVAMDSDGNLLLSLRHFSEVTKINRQTGAIIWRMGGKQNQFTFINDPDSGFSGQHDARRISNGHITIFDNGIFGSNSLHSARGIEYNLNEQNHTAALVWSHIYNSNSTSRFMGNMQRLDNGNSVIGWGGLLNANLAFNCVKPDGGLVMEIRFPDSSITYRAFNYTALPWNLHRPVITCRSSGGNYYLDAPEGYSSYLWSTRDTTRTIQISAPDTYYVFVPYGQGGHISSERVIITNMNNPCEQVGISQETSEAAKRFILEQNYPNPFNPGTKIKFDIPNLQLTTYNVQLIIYDILGREVVALVNEQLKPGTHEVDWNAANSPSGVYYYKLQAGEYTETKKMILLK